MLTGLMKEGFTTFKENFTPGVLQMSFLTTNIKNIAGGHIFWIAVFIFANTYILRNVYRRANTTGKIQWLIYTLGCVLGGIIGTEFQTHVIQPLSSYGLRSFFL